MTMPKKGTRKIVVKGKPFKYVVKPLCLGFNHSRLTVESSDGNHYVSIDTKNQSITPSMVRTYIEKNFDFLTGKNDFDLSKG